MDQKYPLKLHVPHWNAEPQAVTAHKNDLHHLLQVRLRESDYEVRSRESDYHQSARKQELPPVVISFRLKNQVAVQWKEVKAPCNIYNPDHRCVPDASHCMRDTCPVSFRFQVP